MAHTLLGGHIGMVLTPALLGAVKGNDALFFPLVFLHAITALAAFGSIGFAGTYASRAAQLPLNEALRSAAGPAPPPAASGVDAPSPAGEQAPAGEQVRAEVGDAVTGEQVDPETEEIMRYFENPARFWKAVLLVPVFGLLALWVQPHTGGLDQVWALGALLVWAIATLVVISMIMPALRQMRTILRQPVSAAGGPAAELAWRARLGRAGALASRGAVICDLLFFVALALMIWQP